MINRFTEWAQQQGWKIEMSDNEATLPAEITDRYGIPEKWLSFAAKLRVCENKEATVWFLTPADYLPREDGFQWNEFERQSLEWCGDDPEIKAFWNRHLPIVMSVKDGYSYYAVNTENGNIVYGCEPEYEEADVIADSFDDFMDKVISGEIDL